MLMVPVFLQGFLMLIDEFYCHRKRGLGRWERIGHPVDTASVLLCLGVAIMAPAAASTYMICAVFSCLLITKDEWVHSRESNGFENWLHALLFIIHPVVLFCIYQLRGEPEALLPVGALVFALFCYQIVYWNVFAKTSGERL